MNFRNTLKHLSFATFLIAMLLVCCFFLESDRELFFLNENYKGLKTVLSVLLPTVLTFLVVYFSRCFRFLIKAMPIITFLFFIHFFIDMKFIGLIAFYGKPFAMYHLLYNLLAIFTVISTSAIIKKFSIIKLNSIDYYNDFSKISVIIYTCLWIFSFYLMFFHYRTTGEPYYCVNLIPFQGEIRVFIRELKIHSSYGIIRTVSNVLFFVPFEYIVCSVFKRKKSWFYLLFPFVFSVLIETSQYLINNGDSDIDDVILNTLGGVIGYFYFLLVFKLKENKQEGEK